MNRNEDMGVMGGGLLWFGAAVSIAEIFTGALLAPLGIGKGLIAILIGHIIGCVLFYHVGIIGARRRVGAMESTAFTFGRQGAIFFSVLNLLQLLGWTAVMIITGAEAMNTALDTNLIMLWCGVIGALIMVWILAGIKNVSKLNSLAVSALFFLSMLLAFTVFKGDASSASASIGLMSNGQMGFGLALELSIAMPLSWLPLISDYTKHARRPVTFTLVSTLSYFAGSSLMYTIGLGAALYTGSSDVVTLLTASGLGAAALLIALLSTVTTTYLDVYSAGESLKTIFPQVNAKHVGIFVCLMGTLLAIFTPMHQYEGFLLLIGSVFVPMAALLITDFYTHPHASSQNKWNLTNVALWLVGFILYRIFIKADLPIGSTLPVIVIVMSLSVGIYKIKREVIKYVS